MCYEESLHLDVCKLAKYVSNCVVFWKIYTADKNFTRPPVATVTTNSKSGATLISDRILSPRNKILMLYLYEESLL